MLISSAALTKAVVVATTLSLAAGIAFWATSEGVSAASGGAAARAWIDDPLSGDVVAPGPIAVIAHAYDPAGVAQVTLRVDGEEQQSIVPDGAAELLVTVQLSWIPDGEGVFVLEVSGVNPAGQAGLSGRVAVVVRGPSSRSRPEGADQTTTPSPTDGSSSPTPAVTASATASSATQAATPRPSGPAPTSTPAPTPRPATTAPTPKPTPKATPAPTPQPTPTPAPCTPPAPILLSPADGTVFQTPNTVSPTLSWSAWRGSPPACQPSGFRIRLTYGRTIIEEDLPANQSSWVPPNALPCGSSYAWRVTSKRSDGSLANPSATWDFTVVCIPS